MANPHSSVCYVEPNLVFDRKITDTSEFDYGKIINPEDYCIFLSLTVEMSKRAHELKSDFLTLTYTSEGESGSTNINFMGGTMVEGHYNGDKKSTAKPYLTTRYADMYVTDLEDYGTAEMLGIKSVNIEYESATIPIITIKFTDVRGMSLFTPTELSRTNTVITKKNIEESFFQCFFNFPYPKFYITVKGFYGKPVTYEVTCDKFNTNFNAESGNFDIDVRFIGYKYSFLTDVSLEAVLAAPHTDYLGKKYWEEQVNNGHFSITDIYGNKVGMPTLYDLNNKIKDVIASGDPTVSETTISHEEDTHEEEIMELSKIKRIYDDWYATLEQDLIKKYGKDYCYPFQTNTSDDDSIYTRIVILLNRNKEGDSLASDAVQFSEYLKKVTNDLNSAINAYNEKYRSFNKLNNISFDFSQYVRCKLFYPAYINKYTKEIKFGGFHEDNKIPTDEIKKNMFTDKVTDESGNTTGYTSNYDKIVRIIYNDGVDQYIDCFNIEVDYSNIKKRIDYLSADAKTHTQIKESKKKNHERNIALKAALGWNPTIENFTKIVMAHLETFMYMIHTTCNEIKAKPEKRTPKELNVSVGIDGNCPDNADKEFISPFPRVTKTVTNEDGSQRQEDAWVGEFNSDNWLEKDLVETFFNAIEEIWMQNNIENQLREQMKNMDENPYPCSVKYPITSFDFFLDSNVYGDDIISTFDNFVGGVAVRMFDILTINNIKDIKKYASKLGEVEANNFFKSVNVLGNKDLMKWVDANNGEFTAEHVLSAVTETSDKYPWSIDKKTNSNKPLLDNTNWLTRYVINGNTHSYMYPVQNIKFETIGENYNMYANSDNFENTDNIFSFPPSIDGLIGKFNGTSLNNAHYNLIIEDDYFKIGKILEEVTANGCEAYTGDSLENGSTSISKILSKESSLDDAIGGDGDNVGYYRSFFKIGKHTSFSDKLGLKVHKKIHYESSESQKEGFTVEVNDKNIIVQKGEKKVYKLNESGLTTYFDNEIKAKSINNIFLSEVFGYNVKTSDKKKFKEMCYEASIMDRPNFTAYDFLMGIECLDYEGLLTALSKENTTFTYFPRLAVLQLGAMLNYGLSSCDVDINKDNLRKAFVYRDTFDKIIDKYLNKLSIYSRLELIKYYKDWETNFNTRIKLELGKHVAAELQGTTAYNSPVTSTGFYYPVTPKAENQKNKGMRRLFNENSDFIKKLTDDLLLPVLVVNGNINSFVQDKNRKPLSKSNFTASTDVCKNFLNGFIVELNGLLGLKQYSKDENGNVIKLAKESSHTTDDMRIEFYRYLKQLYDRWIPSSSFSDWNFCNFFDDTTECATPSGNEYKFYFIDSYYTKVGNKLIINPQRLSERLDKFYEDLDVNASLYSLLGWVYGDNRCMLKCVQNFMDLGNLDDMKTMFSAMTYSTAMANIKKGQDFVVVYTYEPSKYLNNSSSEFKDDSFMLNEEFYSPIAIRSRGADNAGKSFYKIPAFGVTYGKQYQSYFKNISFNMGQNVQTEQAIRAKHAILLGRTNKNKNNAVAQDLFDIYTTQSYTCTVEMMGCAWVQPMMYFVMLNVPMFRGSYMIMKVSHSITPGDMKTTFTGCRMSNVSNKLIEDIFLDPMADESTPTSNETTRDEYYADVDNDCGYKVYPVFNSGSGSLSGSDKEKAKQLMDKIAKVIYGKDDCSDNAIRIAAASIVGNMWVETSPKFDHTSVRGNDNGYKAGGLCQWNDGPGNLTHLLEKNPKNYGKKEKDGSIRRITPNLTVKQVKDKLAEIGLDYQIEFLNETMSDSLKKKLSASTTAGDAALIFEKVYEVSDKSQNQDRHDKANDFYKSYSETPTQSDNKNEGNEDSKMNEDIYEAFFNSISCTVSSTKSMEGLTLKKSYYSKYITSKGPNKAAPDFVMIISASSDDKKPLLAKLFDCILNSDEYFKYVNKLYWVYGANNPQGAPEHIDVNLSKKAADPNNQRVWVVETGRIEGTKSTQIDETFNEELLKSLAKKRSSLGNDNVMCKLVPQLTAEGIKGTRDIFKRNIKFLNKYSPTCCSDVGDTSKKMGETTRINEGGMIGNWNAKKAAEWLICASSDKSKHICAFAVQQAVVAGGIQCATGNGYRTALNLEKSGNWKFMVTGETSTAEIKGYEPQVGDIMGMTKAGDEKTYGHICMYCGKQYGWISDFKQYNRPYPYSSKGKGKYWIVQYKGGGKATTAKPQRCYNGKCLNQCSA